MFFLGQKTAGIRGQSYKRKVNWKIAWLTKLAKKLTIGNGRQFKRLATVTSQKSKLEREKKYAKLSST